MTGALAAYSMVFMRFAWRVQPRNMLLCVQVIVKLPYLLDRLADLHLVFLSASPPLNEIPKCIPP